jgi:DNA polymerase III alpha subunit
MYQGELEKTTQITSELPYFDITVYPIQYGKSKGQYFMDKANNSIYKGIGSIKYLNTQVGNELYTLSQQTNHKSFINLLYDIEDTSVNSRQLEILIRLDYFSQFGNDKKLLVLYKYFSNLNSRKQLNKESNRDIISLIEKVGVTETFIADNSSQTKKLYKDINFKEILLKIETNIPNLSFGIKERLDAQLDYLTYINKQYDVDNRLWYVIDIADYKNPYVKLHNIRTGDEKSLKLFKYDIDKNVRRPVPKDIIMVDKAVWQRKNKKVNGEWVKSKDKQLVLKKYNIIG